MSYLFSVIIPTYNRADALGKCLESLVNQTYKNFEVIVCDDGSSDNSEEIALNYRERLNLSYFREENWGGPARPRNRGLEHASGEWVCFLDSDDWYSPEKLAVCAEQDLNQYDFFYHSMAMIRDGEFFRNMVVRQLHSTTPYYDLLFNLNTIPTSSTCIRRSVLNGDNRFSEDKALIAVEDIDLWIRLAAKGVRFKLISGVLGYYWMGTDNISFYDERQAKRVIRLYDPYIKAEQDPARLRKMKAALSYLLSKLYTGDKKKTKGFLVDGLRHGSRIIRTRSAYFLLKLMLK